MVFNFHVFSPPGFNSPVYGWGSFPPMITHPFCTWLRYRSWMPMQNILWQWRTEWMAQQSVLFVPLSNMRPPCSGCKAANWILVLSGEVCSFSSQHSALALSITPYEALVWYLGYLKVFGYRAAAHVPDESSRKGLWASKSSPNCIFIGYSDTENLFELWDVDKRVVFRKRDVIFWEHELGHPKLSNRSRKWFGFKSCWMIWVWARWISPPASYDYALPGYMAITLVGEG